MSLLNKTLSLILKFVYDTVSIFGNEPEKISYYAIAIILTSIIFKLLMLPLSFKQTNSTEKMQEIQPKMAKIQEKYKNDPQTMQLKMQELYKEHNYNPASGCFVTLIQLPVAIAFFGVFKNPTAYAFSDPMMYESMNKAFLWIPSLENPDPYLWGLPLLAAFTTYLQSKTMMIGTLESSGQENSAQNILNYMMPIMIFFSAKSFPAGLALYWVINNSFTIIQQLISKRDYLQRNRYD